MLDILLIEDNIDLANTFIDYLDLQDINVDYAPNAEIALNLVQEHDYQCLVLDINLPGINGYQFCHKVRSLGKDVSILMVTAKDQLQDKLEGFDAGADDFLVKPVALEELVARVKVLANRKSGQVKTLKFGTMVMDFNAHQCTVNGQVVNLTPTGWKIIEVLLRKAPDTVSRSEVENFLWGDSLPNSNSLKVHLHKLRQALEQVNNCDIQLETVPNYGLRLNQLS
ncbi:MAG: response regulator transcription factor [Neisseriaceae bacterium]|nr:response regulator [Neisseriaceae bacterium PsAf]MCV2503701.1 response regulator transcription factor [Neisseriaceae bacterium]MCV2509271.1 response regulator transcription factor [Neisseriaceae bacterium]